MGRSADEYSRGRMFGDLGRRDSRCRRLSWIAGLTKFQWQIVRESLGLAERPIDRFKLAGGGMEDPRRSEEGKNAKGGKEEEGEGA
jgi:hypothetical protein